MKPWEILSEFVRSLFIMSATGSTIALLLLILKPIFKNKIPKRIKYYLWILVLVAFLVPFSSFISLPFATPMASLQEMLDENVKTTVEHREELSKEQYGMKYEDLDANEKIDISFNKFGLMKGKLNDYLLFLIITMGGVIFLIEMVQYAVYTIRLHRNRIDVKSNEMELLYNLCKNKKYPQLYRNSVVSVPMLISILQPVIYLPDKKYSSEQLENILLHELTHLNQHDVAIKWIASITACIH